MRNSNNTSVVISPREPFVTFLGELLFIYFEVRQKSAKRSSSFE